MNLILRQRGSYPEDEDNCGRSALHYAIYSGKSEIVELLLSRNYDLVKQKDHAGRTALHHAVFMENNQIQMIDKLIQMGSDVNALDHNKRSPLHHASEGGKTRIIPLLIKNGAILTLRDGHTNKTPLELASDNERHTMYSIGACVSAGGGASSFESCNCMCPRVVRDRCANAHAPAGLHGKVSHGTSLGPSR